MFESLFWEIGAAINVGIASMTCGASAASSIPIKNGIPSMSAAFEKVAKIRVITRKLEAVGESTEDAKKFASIIYDCSENGMEITNSNISSIAKKHNLGEDYVLRIISTYDLLLFLENKGITTEDRLKQIGSISLSLAGDLENGELRDCDDVANELKLPLNEVREVAELLNEFAASFNNKAPQLMKPIILGNKSDDTQSDPQPQRSKRQKPQN